MEIRQLRYFIAVADTLSFSAAAESVFLSQSALSRQIMALEKEMGLSLLKRSTRRVELTEAGELLRRSAKELISRWEKLGPELKNQVEPEHQAMTLTIGCDSRALSWPARRVAVMEMLYRFRRKYRGIRILFQNLGYQELIQGLLEGTLDCAFTLDRAMDHRSEIAGQIIAREEMVLVFRSENRHTDGDCRQIVQNRGLILVDKEPQGLYHILRILNDLALEPPIRFCEAQEDMTMTVETGESAAIVPRSVAQKLENPHLQVLSLPSAQAELCCSLLWNKKESILLLPELLEELHRIFSDPDGHPAGE